MDSCFKEVQEELPKLTTECSDEHTKFDQGRPQAFL